MPDLKPTPLPFPLPPPIILRAESHRLPKIDQGSALIADPNVAVPQEIVTGLIHMLTTVLLASGSKAGKTWFLLALAMCISSGTRFLRWGTTMVKVLFVNLELHRVFMRRRLQIMMGTL